MDQPLRVHPPDHGRKRDRDTQELRHVHRTPKHSLQRLAPGVFEHQGQPTLATNKLDGPRRPLGVEVSSESVFMLEPLERPGRGVFVRAGDQKDRLQAVAEAPVQREPTFLQRRELVSRKIHREGLRTRRTGAAAMSTWREAVAAA